MKKNIYPHTKQEQGATSAKVDKVSSRYGVRVYFYSNLLAWSLVLFLIGNYVFGWTTPTATPPSSNLPAPINVGPTEQTKAGNLIIEGVLRLGQFATAPSGTEGALYYDTTEKKIKVYSSAAWSDLGGGAESGQLPTYTTAQRDALSPKVGQLIYNTTENKVQVYGQAAWKTVNAKLALGATCSLDGDCDSTHCVDGYCCDTVCIGNCNRCNIAGSEGICTDTNLDCTGNCDVCSSGNCVADASLCTGNCDQCTGSGTAYNCSANASLCSNTISSCECSGSGTSFNCQPCSSPYPSNCGYATCSNYTCERQGAVADQSGTINGQTVYCDEHNRLWTPTQSGTYSWSSALSKCSGLTYAGYSDWVLPSCSSRTQNSSCYLYQFGIDACGGYSCAPSWDSYARASSYWSSTEYDGSNAYRVDFADGRVIRSTKTVDSYSVRCVRGQ